MDKYLAERESLLNAKLAELVNAYCEKQGALQEVELAYKKYCRVCNPLETYSNLLIDQIRELRKEIDTINAELVTYNGAVSILGLLRTEYSETLNTEDEIQTIMSDIREGVKDGKAIVESA